MRRSSAATWAVACAAILAGCSGAGEGAEAPTRPAPTPAPGDSDAQGNGTWGAVPVTTDTLWLAPQARLNATAAANLTILATLSGPLPQSFAWNATLNGTGTLTEVRLVVWLDLQNSAAQGGVAGDPGCSAAMTLVLTLNGTATTQPGGCASLGAGVIPPGEHRLEFSTPLTSFPSGASAAPGDGVAVQVQFGLALPQGVGHLLGGADHDSRVRLVGLSEPVGPSAVAPEESAD